VLSLWVLSSQTTEYRTRWDGRDLLKAVQNNSSLYVPFWTFGQLMTSIALRWGRWATKSGVSTLSLTSVGHPSRIIWGKIRLCRDQQSSEQDTVETIWLSAPLNRSLTQSWQCQHTLRFGLPLTSRFISAYCDDHRRVYYSAVQATGGWRLPVSQLIRQILPTVTRGAQLPLPVPISGRIRAAIKGRRGIVEDCASTAKFAEPWWSPSQAKPAV